MKPRGVKGLRREDVLDLEQCVRYLKETMEPLKCLEEIAVRTKKICRFAVKELGFPFASNESAAISLSSSINTLLQKSAESAVFLQSQLLDPIQSFTLNHSNLDQFTTTSKCILDILIRQREELESSREKYYEAKELQESANDSMLRLVKSVETNSIAFKTKIELSASSFEIL
eukprot:TRINITY_DN7196_c0_g6_i1.p1 TRINITY_DN7196_c0_g6~~TRINITY_DN7196_c0_g6_i1.p1  ORF type:complete len:173 (+),score=28.69 TRINITY_DN7196_c0_g6_i1:150-668(+)